jgi:hypothetical protein
LISRWVRARALRCTCTHMAPARSDFPARRSLPAAARRWAGFHPSPAASASAYQATAAAFISAFTLAQGLQPSGGGRGGPVAVAAWTMDPTCRRGGGME